MSEKTIMDVSRWQGRIDWDAVKRSGKIDGVMLRVLGSKGGKPYLDPYFARNYAECARLGIPVGGYYYTCAVTPRQTAAELAALRAALKGKSFQLPIAVDAEDPKLRGLTPAKLSARVAEAAAKLEAWGLYAMVYTYTNFADTALDMDALTAYDLWIADYRGHRPTRKHGMWQYTSKGKIPGVNGPVDLSHAYKDYPAIIQRAGLTKVKGV
uniref:lysozyme n=1 Tax=Myoviridae sp. ctSGr1 TaxID=2827609 RepID=A0A8S5LR62_9CAUD|nr:MAG TPA: PlyB like endolysin [Myoviridae sp. ctSGr1]